MRKCAPHEILKEWLLRMRRTGRPPVTADARRVTRHLGNKVGKTIGSTDHFLMMFGEQKMSQEEWVILSSMAALRWHSHFRDHVCVCRGVTPIELLTSKNAPQVFTSAEVLASLGDLPREVTVVRGGSNLCCLTQRDAGVSRAVLTFSAGGQFHPPTILQKGYDLPHWVLSEDSVDLMASPDGRPDPLVFPGWPCHPEQRSAKADVTRPAVLFVHGRAAHGSPAADSFCCAKGIILHSHHHSPINLMDPFIHLLSPLLHHLNRTQEELTTLAATHPLPHCLLPSILADAWTQVSREKLAYEAFQRSGLVPYDDSKYFTLEKYIQIAPFPPLVLEPIKACFACGDAPKGSPFDHEPQTLTVYHLHTPHPCESSLHTAKDVWEDASRENASRVRMEDREWVSDDDATQMCDPLYIGADPLFDQSLMESAKVIHTHSDLPTDVELSVDHT